MFVVDLEDKSVSFTVGTRLTLAQLWSLIDLMDDEVNDDEDISALLHGGDVWEPQDWVMSWVLPARVYNVQSFSNSKIYCVVRLEDDTWACSCPDYIMRRYGNGDHCKHIKRMYWSS